VKFTPLVTALRWPPHTLCLQTMSSGNRAMLLLVLAQADYSWIVRGAPRLPTLVASRHSGNAIVLPLLFSKSWPLEGRPAISGVVRRSRWPVRGRCATSASVSAAPGVGRAAGRPCHHRREGPTATCRLRRRWRRTGQGVRLLGSNRRAGRESWRRFMTRSRHALDRLHSSGRLRRRASALS
jgi:hypothetical protein